MKRWWLSLALPALLLTGCTALNQTYDESQGGRVGDPNLTWPLANEQSPLAGWQCRATITTDNTGSDERIGTDITVTSGNTYLTSHDVEASFEPQPKTVTGRLTIGSEESTSTGGDPFISTWVTFGPDGAFSAKVTVTLDACVQPTAACVQPELGGTTTAFHTHRDVAIGGRR